MGIVTKQFVAESGSKIERDEGVIDSGASYTVFRREFACKLGFDPNGAREGSIESVGREVLLGHWMPACVAVGSRRGCVEVFVPSAKETAAGDREPFDLPYNVIGVDFLQASKARLDYGRHHNQVFSGLNTGIGTGFRAERPLTPEQKRYLRSRSACEPGNRTDKRSRRR